MRIPFEYIGALQQENKILKKEVADFKSGERFKQIQREHQKLIDEYRRQIKRLNLVIEGLRKDVKNSVGRVTNKNSTNRITHNKIRK